MRKIKNMRKTLVVILLVLILGCSLINNLFNNKDYINDYYMYINNELLEKEEIASDEVGWSNFSKAQERVDEDVLEIVKELINNKTNSNLNIFYYNIMDTDSRNSLGIKPLMIYINLIDNSKSIEEFINNAIIVENELFIDIFTVSTVATDFKDSSKNIVYFYPITYDFGSSSDIYVDSDYSRYHALLKQYQIKLLKLYGYDKNKARDISSKLDRFFVDIASVSKTNDELSDVDSLYNVVTKDELQAIYTNIDIDSYLKEIGIDDQEYFSVIDIDNYKKMNSYLTNDNLDLLKEYVKVKILENYGSYASLEYADCINELNDKLMGISSDEDLEEDAIDLISSYFTNDIDKVYLEKHFSDKDKEVIESLISDILNYYESNIDSVDWLEDGTKEKAILKLKNMKINVGGNYSNISYNLKSFQEGSSLIENVIAMNKTISDDQLQKLKSNDIETIISPTNVNAYYNPLDNSINFPASLKELYDIDDDYYTILGSMGMIIAHEITHAFDNNGAKFDEVGNRVDWWSKEDYKKFEELQNEVIEYYSNYEVIDGIHVDGKMTVGENIADLGAVNCIVGIAKEKKATNEELKILFSSYASLWASEYIDSYQKLLLLSDTHSPDKIRVNAVLASIDDFYETYDINNNDEMYIDKNKRVRVW